MGRVYGMNGWTLFWKVICPGALPSIFVGLRFSLAMAIFDMAKLLGPDDPAVRSVIEEGRGILEELGARLDELGLRARV